MNKKFKRALSSILAFILVVSTLTVMNVSSVFAADTDVYNISDTTASSFSKDKDLTFGNTTNDRNIKCTAGGSTAITTSTDAITAGDFPDGITSWSKYTFPGGGNRNISIDLSAGETVDFYVSATDVSHNTQSVTFTLTDSSDSTSTQTSSTYSTDGYSAKKVSFTVEDDGTYLLTTSGSRLVTFCIVVNKVESVAITDLTVSPSTATINVLGTTQLTAAATPTGASNSVTWTSSDESVATVSSTGLVTSVAAGTATITATSTEDLTITATAAITVSAITSVTAIEISGTNTLTACGGTTQLSAEVTPSDATYTSVDWSTSNFNVAAVDENGLVTGVGVGEATITATAQDGSGVTAEYTVTVSNASEASVISGAMTFDLTDYASVDLTIPTSDEDKNGAAIITDGTVFGSTYLTAEGDGLTRRNGSTSTGIQTGARETGMFKFTTSKDLKLSVTFCSTGGKNYSDLVVLDENKEVAAHSSRDAGTNNDQGTVDKTLTVLCLPAGTYYIGSPTADHGATNSDSTTSAENAAQRGARVKSIVFEDAASPVTQNAADTTPAIFESGSDNSFYVVAVIAGDDLESYASVDFDGAAGSSVGAESDTVYSAVTINGTNYTAESFGGSAGDYVYAVCVDDGENEITQTVRAYAQAMTVVLDLATTE